MSKYNKAKNKNKILVSIFISIIFLLSMPFIVKAASDGEIDIYRIIYDLIIRVDNQDEKIEQLEKEIENLEKEVKERENQIKDLEEIVHEIINPTPTSTPNPDATPTPTPGPIGEIIAMHKVEPGQELKTIAIIYYGSSDDKFINAIVDANKHKYPDITRSFYSQNWDIYIPKID